MTVRLANVTGRGWAYLGAVLGGAVSIAANIAHSYVPPADAPADWTQQGGADVASVFWPVALFVAVEILARIPWPPGRRWTACATADSCRSPPWLPWCRTGTCPACSPSTARTPSPPRLARSRSTGSWSWRPGRFSPPATEPPTRSATAVQEAEPITEPAAAEPAAAEAAARPAGVVPVPPSAFTRLNGAAVHPEVTA